MGNRRRDIRAPTYCDETIAGDLHRFVAVPDIGDCEPVLELAARILEHRFNLLGSGWTRLSGSVKCEGLEGNLYSAADTSINAANRPESERIRALIDKTYEPINWHLDFKSGYRWGRDVWYQDVPYGHLPGVDIKVPWELARMQHLPTLAFAFALADGLEKYAGEFRNQVLDFIVHNPPRFGVNWRCTMDVGIRIANWLVARDLFVAAGATFDDEFEAIFARSVLEHARHIRGNLEWDPDFRANHYLANIVGLLYGAAYLPLNDETDAWLTFAVQELHAEVLRQFGPDGAGFEASTAYHGLSAEMALYGTALALGLGEERSATFSETCFSRLAAAAQFLRDVTKPNGRIAQVGDSDSGRFLKFFNEKCLNHEHLLAAFGGLFGDANGLPETAIVASLAGNRKIAARPEERDLRLSSGFVPTGRVLLDVEFVLPEAGLSKDLRLAAYPDFGLYIWRSERLFLSVRCGPIGLNGRGAHAHNDQLAVELNIDGEDWVADPGSYLYTPLPERRDEYRSVKAHFAPRLGDKEPGNLKLGLFWLGDEAKAEALRFDSDRFVGCHHGFGIPVYREVSQSAGKIRVRDIIDDGGADAQKIVVRSANEASAALGLHVPFSTGYGLRGTDKTP
jgi:hypothetical protein